MGETCKGCGVSVRLSEAEIERIIDEYFGQQRPVMASAEESTRRLSICGACPSLRYGTTCAHCGCLVPVIARIQEKRCPAPLPRW